MPVNTQHAAYKDKLKKWQRCRDVTEGQDSVHKAGESYLPKLKGQIPDDYKSMVMRTPFYNATWRTIAGLVGMIFRKPPKIEHPESVEELLKDVTGTGQPLTLTLQKLAEETLKYGRVGVLVDYPESDPEMSKAAALELQLRPTMVTYDTFSIINWRAEVIANQRVLTFIVLYETVTEQDSADEFCSKVIDQWRVLDLVNGEYRVRKFRLDEAAVNAAATQGQATHSPPDQARPAGLQVAFKQYGKEVFPTMNGKPLKYIPMLILGTDDVSTDVDDPPLIDLVDMNLSHYRTSADLEHGCHFTALPTLFLAGMREAESSTKVYIGSETAIVTANEKAHADFIEFSGAGLKSLEARAASKEQMMAILGARMLEPQKAAAEAADSSQIRRKGEESMLGSVAVALGLASTQLLKWFVEWAGVDPKDCSVELNRDFYPVPMSPTMLTALISGWQQGAPGLSDQGLFDALKQGEVISEEADLEEEQARIADRQREMAQQNFDLQNEFAPPGVEDPNAAGTDPNATTTEAVPPKDKKKASKVKPKAKAAK